MYCCFIWLFYLIATMAKQLSNSKSQDARSTTSVQSALGSLAHTHSFGLLNVLHTMQLVEQISDCFERAGHEENPRGQHLLIASSPRHPQLR